MKIISILKNSQKIKKMKLKILFLRNLIYDYLILIECFLKNKEKKIKTNNYIIVTASDKEFFDSLIQLLNSINKYEPNAKIIVYDIGLEQNQIRELNEKFTVEYREFLFHSYPDFFASRDSFGKLGAYAWKSAILSEVVKEYSDNLVLWLDSGNTISNPLNKLRYILSIKGFYSPISAGNVKDWCYKDTLKFLNPSDDVLELPNLTGGLIGINTSNSQATDLLFEWEKYSAIEECIAPKGSDRSNHRQDQSVLTILFHKTKKLKGIPKTKKISSILVNQNPGNRVYLLDSDSDSDSIFKTEWIKSYNKITTNTIKYSHLIWILEVRSSRKIQKKYYRSKKLVINVFSEKDILFLKSDKYLLRLLKKNKVHFLVENNMIKNMLIELNQKENRVFIVKKLRNFKTTEPMITKLLAN
jgi:hypothetical protein